MNEQTAGLAGPDNILAMPRFAGVVTFFRLPHLTDPTGLDIAVCGVPFDGGITNRTGARHGPRQVREMTHSHIRPFHPTTNRSPFEMCTAADLGDVPINPIVQKDSLQSIEDFFARIHAAGAIPLAAAGDHLISLPILRAIARDRPVGMVHFDAHTDTYDAVFGESPAYDNGTPFRRAVEEALVDPKRVIQIGIRGPRFSADDLAFSLESGMRVVEIEEYFALGNEGVAAEARRVVGDGPTYVSFDVDGLDAVFVPGTGALEIGGYAPRDAQVMIRGLRGLDIIGADMVEVSPPLAPLGGTARVGANMMFELSNVMAEAVVNRKGD